MSRSKKTKSESMIDLSEALPDAPRRGPLQLGPGLYAAWYGDQTVIFVLELAVSLQNGDEVWALAGDRLEVVYPTIGDLTDITPITLKAVPR